MHGADPEIAPGFELSDRGGAVVHAAQQGVDDGDLSDAGLGARAPAEQRRAADRHGKKREDGNVFFHGSLLNFIVKSTRDVSP